MLLEHADIAAAYIKGCLAPHCDRIEIAGSVRRRCSSVGDIEIVCIPKIYEAGLFGNEPERTTEWFQTIEQWKRIRGDQNGKYMAREVKIPKLDWIIQVDIFTATSINWGLILAIRTGSARYSHMVLACGWVRAGYNSVDGNLVRASTGEIIPTPEEEDLFRLAQVKWIEPERRTL